jgi:hypothetical protein
MDKPRPTPIRPLESGSIKFKASKADESQGYPDQTTVLEEEESLEP